MFHNLLNSILKKKLYLFITVFAVLVVGISLGSAILTKTLSIGGKTKIQNNWIIYFDEVVLNTDSVKNDDTSKDAKIVDFEKQNIEFSANLSSITDFYEFDVYTVNDGHKYAINNIDGYDNVVTINGGLIESEETAISHGNIVLNGGTIKGTMYGVYNSKNLTISSDDGTIKCDYHKVIGDSYGIYNNTDSIFNFYDGYIMGSTSPKNDNVFVSNRPNGYKDNTIFDNETGYNYMILEQE